MENVKNSKSKTISVKFYAGFPNEQFLETKIIASMQPISHFHWHFSFFSWNSTIIGDRWSGCGHSLSCHCYWLLFSKTESKQNDPYSPCWISKTLPQKPTVSPVHNKIPNESKKRLVAQKQAIFEDYYIRSSLKTELDTNENAIVKAKVCNHSLGGFRNEVHP